MTPAPLNAAPSPGIVASAAPHHHADLGDAHRSSARPQQSPFPGGRKHDAPLAHHHHHHHHHDHREASHHSRPEHAHGGAHAPTARCVLAHHSIILPPGLHSVHRRRPRRSATMSPAAAAAAAAATSPHRTTSGSHRRVGDAVVASALFERRLGRGADDATATATGSGRGRGTDSSSTFTTSAASSSASRTSPTTGGVDDEGFVYPHADPRVPAWLTVTRTRWDDVTTNLASSATVPFLFLTAPQIMKNAALIAAGRPDALAAISWQGQVAGLLGNLLLLSYFSDKGEGSASVVQVVGVCATGALLTQMCLAGHIPLLEFSAAAVAVALGVVLSALRMLGQVGPVDPNGVPCVGNVQCAVDFGSVDDDDDPMVVQKLHEAGDFAWDAYQSLLAIVGLAALPQVGLVALLPPAWTANWGMLPGAIGGLLGLVLVVLGRAGKLPEEVDAAWGALSGWSATLLFMTMPVAQLANNFANPSSLEGLSVLSSVLAMTGNALMVPRALFTRDVIWLTGSTWGSCLMGWGVMLSLLLGRDASGARYISPELFSAISIAFFGFIVVVFVADGLASLAAGRPTAWRLRAWRFAKVSA